MAPCPAVADLFGRAARFELRKRMADRGERHLPPFLLQGPTDFRLSQRARRRSLQDFFDYLCVAAPPPIGWPGLGSGASARPGAPPAGWFGNRRFACRPTASLAPGWGRCACRRRAGREFSDGFHRRGVSSREGLTANFIDLLLQRANRGPRHRPGS
jgi:hypothetical protein